MSSDRAVGTSLRQVGLPRTGTDWDVIQVDRFLALQAIERIGAPGAVTVDPRPGRPSLSFLVQAGASSDWQMPHTVAYAAARCLPTLPPDHKEAPPGPYWLIHRSHGLTRVDELRQALETVADRSTSPCARIAALHELLAPGLRPFWSPQRHDALRAREAR